MSKTEKELKKEFEADYKVEPRFNSTSDGHIEAYEKVIGIITKPAQYDIGIDTFTRMRANANLVEAMGFIRWNIDKYNTRKKGQDKSDYKKIIDYCNEALWWLDNYEDSK
jgi:hypothetical protein